MIEKMKDDFEGVDTTGLDKVISGIDDYIVSLSPPKDFSNNSSENVLDNIDKSFEYLCTSMEEVGIVNPKLLTVFEFNAKIDYFQSKKV